MHLTREANIMHRRAHAFTSTFYKSMFQRGDGPPCLHEQFALAILTTIGPTRLHKELKDFLPLEKIEAHQVFVS